MDPVANTVSLDMWRYVLRRLAQIPIVLIVVTITIFVVVRSTPGDPVQIMLGMQTSPEAVEAIRKEFHFDKPLYRQYLIWLGDVVHGDLGRSVRLNQSVSSLLVERFPISFRLALAAMLFAIFVSIPLGIFSALRRNTWIDYLCTGVTLVGFSIPNFALAMVLIYVFSVKLEILPITGIGATSDTVWGMAAPYILPSLALGMLQVAVLTRLLRSSMIDVLAQDYIRTARAKGLLPPYRAIRARAQERPDSVRDDDGDSVWIPDRHPGDHRIYVRDPRHGIRNSQCSGQS